MFRIKEELLYLDANIYMDYFESREDRLRPLGEFAFNILRRTLQCEFKIVISNLVIKELEYNSYGDKINELIKELKESDKLIFVRFTQEDKLKTKQIKEQRKTNFNDTGHALLAKKAKATYVVTRNINDFVELQDIIKACFPENL